MPDCIDTASIDGNEVLAARSNGALGLFAVRFSMPEVSYVDRFVRARSEEPYAIRKEFQHNGPGKTVVVHGLCGMSKTQVALAYAQ
jgi:hypothetical protein